ncbi:hypothetical protein WI80_28710 [Burkholderia ubonensis]|uniref:hypothetical protein n=1 Tax=Burkholderia ubonensis TaxID=101571 RepID=UPI000756C562|nr:hypothetical protein [Burkholderia ubonensis]KVD22361.1 hypothetical protein WI80_28710 [Burkholderia ubonensis]KVU16969.1 hypothetical protein WK63_11230 [Burkholderia ubonensis]
MSADAERLALLASLGVPLAQPEVPELDAIEQAAGQVNMTRAEFVSFFDGAGEETLDERARRILRRGPGSMADVVLRDDYVAGRRTAPTMNYRGRWKFPR